MRRLTLSISFLLLLIVVQSPLYAQENAQTLLRLGLYKEQVEGDLQSAIKLFERLIDQYPNQRTACAWAHLYIGLCYEKLGEQQLSANAYRKIIERYADQAVVASEAKKKIASSFTSKNPFADLVEHYINEAYTPILDDISPDGTKEALTDWTTGNLVIRDRRTGKLTELTHKTWEESPAFAYWKVWSRDGKRIAYTWCRDAYFGELRVISAEGGEPTAVFGQPGWTVMPKDWFPDGRHLAVLLGRHEPGNKLEISPVLAIVDLGSRAHEEVRALHGSSRGVKVSPDGNNIVFDYQAAEEKRKILLFSLPTHQEDVLASEVALDFDTPIWSADGKYLLFRSGAGGGFALNALPIRGDRPSGQRTIIDANIGATVLSKFGMSEGEYRISLQRFKEAELMTEKPALEGFQEEFSSPTLDPSWSVIEWQGKNVYGFSRFGSYSLTAHPGHLRYFAHPMMTSSGWPYLGNNFSYWYYPALQLRKKVTGEVWVLETKATYSLIGGVDDRTFALTVVFGVEGGKSSSLEIRRARGWGQAWLSAVLMEQGRTAKRFSYPPLADEPSEAREKTFWMRVTREDSVIRLDISNDGITFRHVLEEHMSKESFEATQYLVITGDSWFCPAGSYVDWDYFRFRPLRK